MHDPMVVVFDIKVPIPAKREPRGRGRRWSLSRERWIGGPQVGGPIRRWWRPYGWEVVCAGWRLGWMDVATVWHEEPDGHDSGEVCKGMGSSGWHRGTGRWAWQHRDHLSIHWRHWRKAKRWLFDRCDRCGKPFRGRYRSVYGTWGGQKKWHDHCSLIVSLIGQGEAMAEFIVTGGNQWQANYLAKGIHERATREREVKTVGGDS